MVKKKSPCKKHISYNILYYYERMLKVVGEITNYDLYYIVSKLVYYNYDILLFL